MESVIVAVIIGVVVIGLAVLGYLRNKRRREAIAAWARQRGWSYVARDDSFTARFRGTPFDRGDNRKARNVVVGRQDERPIVAFDYSYETHSTDSHGNRTTQTHNFSVVAISLPRNLPKLQVTREGIMAKLGRAVGIRDVEFENEDFNKRFNVHCDDRKLASDVLHPRMMQFLLDAEGPAWRIDGTDLLCWDDNRNDPAIIDQRLAFLNAVVGQVPRFVWQPNG